MSPKKYILLHCSPNKRFYWPFFKIPSPLASLVKLPTNLSLPLFEKAPSREFVCFYRKEKFFFFTSSFHSHKLEDIIVLINVVFVPIKGHN